MAEIIDIVGLAILFIVGMAFLARISLFTILAFVVLSSYSFSIVFTEQIISFVKSIRDGSSERLGGSQFSDIRWENLRTILAFSSATVGMVFLALGSFSEDQFGENHRLECVLVVIFTAFLVAAIFLRKNIISFLENICGRYLYTKAMVECISLAMVSAVAFLIKYPRFDIRSPELTTSCIHEDEEINGIYDAIQSRLYVFGSFSLLTMLVSPQGRESIALKVSSWLLGLTIDTSMGIPGRDGPNLHYMFGTALFCIFLIFLKPYMDSQLESSDTNTFMVGLQKVFTFVFILILCFGANGLRELHTSPWDNYTFHVEYISFLFLGGLIFMEMDPKTKPSSDHCNQCELKASMNIFLVLITGILIISNKANRIQIASRLKKICADQVKVKKLPNGSQFNLYSAAAFSLYALIISLEKGKSVELGIFDFLHQLTMDTSVDLASVWYMVGASLYCVVLILARIYLAPVKTRTNSNDGEQSHGESSSSGTEGQQQLETRILIGQETLQKRITTH